MASPAGPPTHESSTVLWPAIGTIIFVVCVPGSVVGLVPFLLSGWKLGAPFSGSPIMRASGIGLLVCGAPIFFDFVTRFVREGRGTPAPIAPTRRLVVNGTFRYVRNPGYIAVVAMVLGQGLLFASWAIVLYAALLALGFHVFVRLYEEPTLHRQFGAEYAAYCARVHRWIPRRPRHAGAT